MVTLLDNAPVFEALYNFVPIFKITRDGCDNEYLVGKFLRWYMGLEFRQKVLVYLV